MDFLKPGGGGHFDSSSSDQSEAFPQPSVRSFLQKGLLQVVLHTVEIIQELSPWEYNAVIEAFNRRVRVWLHENFQDFTQRIHYGDM